MCEQALCSYYQANQISGTKMCAHVFKLQGVYSRSCHLWKEKLRRSKSTHMTHYWEKSSILLNRFPYFLLSKSTLQESNTSLCTENVFPPPQSIASCCFTWISTQKADHPPSFLSGDAGWIIMPSDDDSEWKMRFILASKCLCNERLSTWRRWG